MAVTESQSLVAGSDGHPRGLLVLMVAIAVLMVSPIRYPKLAGVMRVLPPQLTFLFLVGLSVMIGVLGPWLALVIMSSMYAVYPLLRLLLVGTSDDANMATGGGR
jgi:phosphatidylserine synthase